MLKAYNGPKKITRLGTCRLRAVLKDEMHRLLFSVVPKRLTFLLGGRVCEDLGMVQRVYHINSENSFNSILFNSIQFNALI